MTEKEKIRLKTLLQKFHTDKAIVITDEQLNIVYDWLFNGKFYPIKEKLSVRNGLLDTILYLKDMVTRDRYRTLDALEMYYESQKDNLEAKFKLLDFEPLFYIIDKGCCKMMIVKKENKYEYSGVWMGKTGVSIPINGSKHYLTDIWPANLGKSHIQEYVTNYEFTKSKDEAYEMLDKIKDNIPMTAEQMQNLNQDQSFHY